MIAISRVSQVAPSEANRNLFESLNLQKQLLWVKKGQNFMLRAVKNVYSRFWPIFFGFSIFLAKVFESSLNFLLNHYRRTFEKLIRYYKYYAKLDAIEIKILNMWKRYKKCSKVIIFIFLLWSFEWWNLMTLQSDWLTQDISSYIRISIGWEQKGFLLLKERNSNY